MIDTSKLEIVNTSWMLPGTACWVPAIESENTKLVYFKAYIIGLDGNR